MIRLLRKLEDMLWPRGVKCLCCDDLSGGALLCPTCADALKAMRLAPSERGYGQHRSVYRYDGAAKQLVLLLKEQCAADAALALADGLSAAVRDMELPPDTVMTWVSMPELRRTKRGIDHGRTLCEAVAAQTGHEVRQLLERTRNVHTQRGLDREARLQNLSATFACRARIDHAVLLIDDVMTTGATAEQCSVILREAGAPQVFVLTATKVLISI